MNRGAMPPLSFLAPCCGCLRLLMHRTRLRGLQGLEGGIGQTDGQLDVCSAGRRDAAERRRARAVTIGD